MTTTKKFKTNPVAKKIKQENIVRSEQAKQALENAAQVKGWSKYDVQETPSSIALAVSGFFVGVLIGLVITATMGTPSIIQACN